MRKRMVKTIVLLVVVAGFLFCNEPAICVDVVENATVNRIGYDAINSVLSICFVNETSYCTPGLPYKTNRLDISLVNFEYTYISDRTEDSQLFPLPQGSQILFNGNVACNDSCRILIPVILPKVSITYIKGSVGGIALELDTNGTKAAEFSVWDFN